MNDIILGSHVGMSGKEMFLGSVKEAESYGANALMVYTGAPQNTRRKDVWGAASVRRTCLCKRMRCKGDHHSCTVYHQSGKYRKAGHIYVWGIVSGTGAETRGCFSKQNPCAASGLSFRGGSRGAVLRSLWKG